MSQGAAVVGSDLDQNEEYRRLNHEHGECEGRLNALTDKVVLSTEEELEEKNLKKRKLELKDRMEVIARQARQGSSH